LFREQKEKLYQKKKNDEASEAKEAHQAGILFGLLYI